MRFVVVCVDDRAESGGTGGDVENRHALAGRIILDETPAQPCQGHQRSDQWRS